MFLRKAISGYCQSLQTFNKYYFLQPTVKILLLTWKTWKSSIKRFHCLCLETIVFIVPTMSELNHFYPEVALWGWRKRKGGFHVMIFNLYSIQLSVSLAFYICFLLSYCLEREGYCVGICVDMAPSHTTRLHSR